MGPLPDKLAAAPRGVRGRSLLATAAVLLVLIALAVVMVQPFLWMLSHSFKTASEAHLFPPRLLPRHFGWENYAAALKAAPYGLYLGNTVFVAVLVTAGQLITSSMAAYAFAWIPFRGNGALFLLYLAVMMVPGQVTIIFNYFLVTKLGLLDSLWGLIIPALANPFAVFLIRQHLLTIPGSLVEAARMDGASDFTVYRAILMPLSKPIIITLGVLTIMSVWNDLLWPLIIITSEEKRTLVLGMASFAGMYTVNLPQMMAFATLTVLPLLLLFLCAQRFFTEGIALSGMK